MVNNSPSNEGSAGVIPDWEAKIPHVPPGQKKTKTQNRNNIVTNSINTLKMVNVKKKKLENYLNFLNKRNCNKNCISNDILKQG